MEDLVLVYDDDCGFCTWWADFLQENASYPIVGFSELTPALRDRLPADYESCSHFVTPDTVYSCGASIEEAMLHSGLAGSVGRVIRVLRRIPFYGRVREWGYQRVAHNRVFWGKFMSKTPPARQTE